jgi:hypothetical protein
VSVDYETTQLPALSSTLVRQAVLLAVVDPVDMSAQPAGPGGGNKRMTIGQLLPGVVWPSGDTAGAKDVANVLAAITSDGAATLMPGLWFGASTVAYGLGQVVQGLGGRQVTQWNNVGSTTSFLIDSSTWGGDASAALKGLHIDGSGASSGACAIQAGDIAGIEIDAHLSNFTSGNDGMLAKNAYNWTEQAKVRLRLENCDNGVRFDQSGSGTNSFFRSEFDLTFDQVAGQNGVVFAGSTVGALLLGGVLRMHGNWGGSATAITSSTISFLTAYAGIQSCEISVNMETGGPDSAQTINFKDGTTNISDCWGGIQYLNTGYNFAPSNNADNFTNFAGPVQGDPSLVSGLPQRSTNAGGSAQAIVSTTAAAVTALAAGVAAYTAYDIDVWVPYSSTATAGAPKFAFTGPAQTANTKLRYEFWTATGLASPASAQVTDFTTVVSGPTLTSSSSLLVRITGTVQCTAYGTLQLTAAEGTSGDSFSILLGAKMACSEMQY